MCFSVLKASYSHSAKQVQDESTYQESAYDMIARHVSFLSGHMSQPRMAGYFYLKKVGIAKIIFRPSTPLRSTRQHALYPFCKIIRYCFSQTDFHTFLSFSQHTHSNGSEFRNQITMVFPPGTMTGMPSTDSHTSIADGFETRE